MKTKFLQRASILLKQAMPGNVFYFAGDVYIVLSKACVSGEVDRSDIGDSDYRFCANLDTGVCRMIDVQAVVEVLSGEFVETTK